MHAEDCLIIIIDNDFDFRHSEYDSAMAELHAGWHPVMSGKVDGMQYQIAIINY